MNTINIPMKVSVSDGSYSLGVSKPKDISVGLDTKIEAAITEHYRGPYEFTPTSEAQTIPVSGLLAERDITIQPIPNNYGLIEWNGSTLTIS